MKKSHPPLSFIFIIFCWFYINGYALNLPSNEVSEPPAEGNFALSSSQQPGPFFSFGQNIVGKNQLQLFIIPNYQKSTGKVDQSQLTSSLLYGISDSASLLISVPFALNYHSDLKHSNGLADSGLQFEYDFYDLSTAHYTAAATIVTALTLPTGSYAKSPTTGNGSFSSFLGTTYNQTYVDWLWFVSPAVIINANHNNIHMGTQYLYQMGSGRALASVKDKYILFALLELDGLYAQRNKILGAFDPNSGGNTLLITPSLSFSTPKIIAQLGISLPISQSLNGVQTLNQYALLASFAWTFQ
ncbi:MAG: hypothetical protein PSV35_07075 [bacterium]|nr:hypothetical protein [bacterium]